MKSYSMARICRAAMLAGAVIAVGVAKMNAQQTIVVDDFSPAGVSPNNPPNHDYYSSAQSYTAGQIANVYWNWFGGAFQSAEWDANTDANTNSNSGSLKVKLNWPVTPDQFVLWDQGETNNYFQLNLNALTFTNFQCDVKFAPGSASDTGNGTGPGGTNTATFGHLRFGDRTSSYNQDWFGAVDILNTNTGWVHVSIPLNALADSNLTNLNGLLIGIDSGYYNLKLNGPSTFWVDNIKFVGASVTVTTPPPTLSIQPARPALRVFAGSTVNTYDREELVTVNQGQSWVGGTYPKTYSFKLLSTANFANFQTHVILIPVNQANANIYGNEYVDYNASNSLWLQINGNANGSVVANVSWKTNSPNANPNNLALNITNATGVGTWTITFNSATSGTLTAPGAAPAAFTINDPTVASDFADPVVAIFGIQPQTTGAYGSYVDYANINITGVSSGSLNEDFTTESAISANWNTTDSAYANSLVLATTATPYWVYWTLPDSGFDLGVAPDLTSGNWYLPEYYNNYGDGIDLPSVFVEGITKWALIPATTLPTVGAVQGGTLAPDAFYRLFNPPLTN
jgi:hypothetical protein